MENPNFGVNESAEMVGCVDNEDGYCNVLTIDVESILTCDQYDGDYCRSKHFAYDSHGQCSNPDIHAQRRENGDTDEDEQYELYMEKIDGKWQRSCSHNDNYPHAKMICQWFEKL